MRYLAAISSLTASLTTSALAVLLSLQAISAELPQQTFANGKKGYVDGVILSHEGSRLKVRGQDATICTIYVFDDTKIKGSHAGKDGASSEALLPGLYIKASGKGYEKGQLGATKITFDASSLKTYRQVDARAAVVETRLTAVEQRSETLENRAGELENRTGQLDEQSKQTQAQVIQVQQEVRQVKTQAAASAQRIDNVEQRVSELDQYTPKFSETVYFATASSRLSPAEKEKLDRIAQQVKAEKGYSIQVAGFADNTGTASFNEDLSDARALAVVRYLQQAEVPLHRIAAPAGMGTTHALADNQTWAGRKQNRRVEITVLVNQGLAGSTQPGEPSAPTLTAAEHN